jgi:O-antigen/teichoic acid export membrane protein
VSIQKAALRTGPTLLNHIRNSIWSIAEGVGYPVLLLIATPIFLKKLGPSEFGLWSLLTTITSMGVIVNAGLSASIVKLIGELGESNDLDANPIVRGGMAIAGITGGALAFTVATTTALFSDTIFAKMGAQQLVIATGTTAAIILWIDQFDTVLSAFLRGKEKFSLSARIEIIIKSFQMLCCILVVVVFEHIVILYSTLLITSVIRLLIKAIVVKSIWPNINLRPSSAFSSNILIYSKWGWLQGGGSIFFGVADKLIIGTTLGSVSLGYYSIATQLAAQLHTLVASAFSIIAPRVSRHSFSNTSAHFQKNLLRLIEINISIAVIGALLLLLFGKSMLTVWVGETVTDIIYQVFQIIVLAYFLLAMSVVPFHCLSGFGEMKFIALVCITGGTFAFITSLILIPTHGLVGAAVSRCIYSSIALSLFLPLLSRILRK